MLGSKTCACGNEFTPRPSNYAKAKRCPECAAKRRRGGSPGRPAHKRRDEQRALDTLATTHVIAFDGEGVDEITYIGDGDPVDDLDPANYWENHVYSFMSAYDETTQTQYRLHPRPGDRRLRTQDILWWMWKVTKKPDDGGKCEPWFYSAKYDWTGVFRDIIIQDVISDNPIKSGTLWQVMHPDQFPDGIPRDPFEPVWWEGWGITYIQGTVTLYRRRWDRDKKEWISAGRRHFADAFKCFGAGSFVSWLEAWEVTDQAERDEIQRMKDLRGHFERIDEEVMSYCDREVQLLAQGVKKIKLVFGSSEIGIRPRMWFSAGSAAKALMAKNHVEDHRGPDRFAGAPDEYRDYILRAYIGGWFENAESGLFDILESEDFKSAYPATIVDLPCMACGHWQSGNVPGAINIGHVEWEPAHNRELRWAPFPWRYPEGRIYRPHTGEGWYYEAEIRAAQRLRDYDITELGWISYVPECDHKPFAFVQATYDLRVEWGGDGRGLALKVTLNSVYGVTADTLSIDSRYANIVWAGMITAGTRAKILGLIADHGDQIVSVATDGILSTKPVLGRKTKVLGELNYEGPIRDVLLIQPGAYLAAEGHDPKKTIRNRGHALKDMRKIEADLRAQWNLYGWDAQVSYKRTRFIPAKLALSRKDPLLVYGQWITEDVTLKFKPSNREPVYEPGQHKRSVPSARHISHMLRKYPEDWSKLCSAPYDRLVSMEYNREYIERREVDNAQP